jgi:hypothetical protein
VWGALVLCTILLAAPPYWSPLAHVLGLARPDAVMWAIVIGMGLAPLAVVQAITQLLERQRSRDAS